MTLLPHHFAEVYKLPYGIKFMTMDKYQKYYRGNKSGIPMTEIVKLLKRGESEKVEFKLSLSQMDKIMDSISAFSNTNVGTIVIGVSDKRKVVGVDIGERTIENLANRIKQNTDPNVYPLIHVEEVNDKHVVVIEVEESEQKPVLAFGRAYKRVGKSNQKLGYEEIRKLALKTSKVYWDERVCENASLEDIEEEKVRWFLKEARHKRGLDINENSPIEEVLLRLKLLKDGKPTNGAILLFAKDPQRFFIQSEVKCIRFKGVDVTGEMVDLRTVDGDVFDQLIEAEKFIFNNIALSAWIEEGKIQRQERWEYPPKAIREALANAICHRDYETTSKVQLRIFDDRLEFWNPGRLPEGWTVETLKRVHESIPRNPSNLEQLGLNERQKKAITYLKEQGKIDRKTYCNICGVGKTVAHEELADMVNKELIEMVGKGRGVYYILRMKRTISGQLADN
jgi:ATP-dependent DNA helicase RecG